MDLVDCKAVFERQAQGIFEESNVVLGVLAQLGTQVYRVAWAGNPTRAKVLIERIMECVSSLRENQWDKLLHLATVMGDDDLVQTIIQAKTRRGVVRENWVV